MYSYDERKKVVEWYYKLGSIKAVQHLLEYPSKNTLKAWMKEFEETDDFIEGSQDVQNILMMRRKLPWIIM